MSDYLQQLSDRVHGYWVGSPVPEDEPAKHQIVREFCEFAKSKGLTEAEIDAWALHHEGEPTVAVVSVKAMREAMTRLKRPGGVDRFRRRLKRKEGKQA